MGVFADFFNNTLSLLARPMTLTRLANPNATIQISVTPSNYARELAGPSGTVIEGREFTISARQMKAPFVTVKRNDRLTDAQLGSLTITEVQELYDVGGDIMGFRVRTN